MLTFMWKYMTIPDLSRPEKRILPVHVKGGEPECWQAESNWKAGSLFIGKKKKSLIYVEW